MMSEDLKKRIKYLEEELLRKDKEMQRLREDNALMMKTSLKQAEKNQLLTEKNLELIKENNKLKLTTEKP